MPTSSFAVPLPSSWPKHAKAATLHVISLAHFALTQVRGWAANSPIHRVRLAAERDQLNSEVAMLREEIRIKDARMAVGSNSASMWWLNGKEAVNLFGDRRMVMDDCVSKRLTLNKGRNVIRGAVINGPGLSDFCIRFIDENGEPIKDLTLSLENAGNQ